MVFTLRASQNGFCDVPEMTFSAVSTLSIYQYPAQFTCSMRAATVNDAMQKVVPERQSLSMDCTDCTTLNRSLPYLFAKFEELKECLASVWYRAVHSYKVTLKASLLSLPSICPASCLAFFGDLDSTIDLFHCISHSFVRACAATPRLGLSPLQSCFQFPCKGFWPVS